MSVREGDDESDDGSEDREQDVWDKVVEAVTNLPEVLMFLWKMQLGITGKKINKGNKFKHVSICISNTCIVC